MKSTFKAAHVSKMTAPQRRSAFEKQIDLLESRIREKMDVSTGFADAEVKARKLEVLLRHYDTAKKGTLNFNEFFVALTNLNFVGVQREIEALFYRYDINSIGVISYHDFAFGLFGLEGRIILDKFASRTLEKVKAVILEHRGALGVANFLRRVRAIDRDGAKLLPRQEVMTVVREFMGLTVSVAVSDLAHLLDSLQIGESEMVSYAQLCIHANTLQQLILIHIYIHVVQISSVEFLRGFLTGMSSERKQIAANLYRQFDGASMNEVSAQNLLSLYDATLHPDAIRHHAAQAQEFTFARSRRESYNSNSNSGENDIYSELAGYFRNGLNPGYVSMVDFLDFYYGISLTFDDDEEFELSVRNAWHASVGALVGAASRRINVSSSATGLIDTIELQDNLTSRVWDKNTITNKLQRSGYDLRLHDLVSK
jgi:hypothetical protein